MLYVLSEPKPSLPVEEFHDWYNNEHGPLRIQLPFVENGLRYKTDSTPPVWLASYDLTDVSGLQQRMYTRLRDERSDRETRIVENELKYLDRRIYSLVSSRGSNFSPAPVSIAVTLILKPADVEEFDRWYERVSYCTTEITSKDILIEPHQEHTSLLSKVPGWIRTRRFRLLWSEDMKPDEIECLAIHEYESKNGLEGPEHDHARSTPWWSELMKKIVRHNRKAFEFYHEFHAAKNLTANGVLPHITTCDRMEIQYQFDGSEDSKSPVVVFSNSLLTNFDTWDKVVEALKQGFPNYRFLRYNTRGYRSINETSVTIDVLADDVEALLDALGIKKCDTIIGDSMGGVTALNFAIRHPSRLDRFIACDCNASSTEMNNKAWEERIALAKSDGGMEKLAEKTIHRWFTPPSYQAKAKEMSEIRKMITSASLEGLIACVTALCDYDISSKIEKITVPGLCVVGAGDGVLPPAMRSFSKKIPNASFVEIPEAGHLPMVENPSEFIKVVQDFLKR